MKAAAWLHVARGGQAPPELDALSLVDRFGAQAVYGRPLLYHEMQGMAWAEAIERFYKEKKQSKSVFWDVENPYKSKVLKEAERLAKCQP